MMPITPVLSTSGYALATVRASWHLTRRPARPARVRGARLDYDEDPNALLPRRRIETAIRETLHAHAEMRYWWRDHVSEDRDEATAIGAWAQRQIEHAFGRQYADAQRQAAALGLIYRQ